MMLMRRKMMKPAVAVAALMMSSTALQADEINLYSVNTGSWIYHLSNNHGQYTEGFDNQFASVERRFSEDSPYSLLAGTMKNSFDDRCIALGFAATGSRWATAGCWEFMATLASFFSAFEHCGDHGSYKDFKDARHRLFSLYLSWFSVQLYRLFRR
jgi:hypothetical protein